MFTNGVRRCVLGVLLSVARREPGVNVNAVSDEHAVDAVSGNAAFNGLPVTLERCESN